MNNQLLLAAQVWTKAIIVPGYDPRVWRKDICGAWINAGAYGDRNSVYGWEIDHAVPVAKGGTSLLWNLRPLHWKNNVKKADGSLVCAVRG
jgi:hypothetical protein